MILFLQVFIACKLLKYKIYWTQSNKKYLLHILLLIIVLTIKGQSHYNFLKFNQMINEFSQKLIFQYSILVEKFSCIGNQ